MSNVRFIGLDVHAETIAVAAAEPAVRCGRGRDPQPDRVDPQAGEEAGPVQQLRVCYEAGPTGYVVYWQLTALGVKCDVVAPTLVPSSRGSGQDGPS
jgi:transposase